MQRHSRLARRTPLKTSFAKKLRSNATEAERRLWAVLRNKQIAGLRFRRQQPIGPYVIDFYCAAAKLIIEVDGDRHGGDQQHAYDQTRTEWLSSNGYRVLRFSNGDVLKNPQIVLDAVAQMFEIRAVPLPEIRSANFDPPSRGG